MVVPCALGIGLLFVVEREIRYDVEEIIFVVKSGQKW